MLTATTHDCLPYRMDAEEGARSPSTPGHLSNRNEIEERTEHASDAVDANTSHVVGKPLEPDSGLTERLEQCEVDDEDPSGDEADPKNEDTTPAVDGALHAESTAVVMSDKPKSKKKPKSKRTKAGFTSFGQRHD